MSTPQNVSELIGANTETGSGISNPEIELGMPTSAPEVMDLTPTPTSKQRVEADLSVLPSREPEPSEVIKTAESIQAEIFGEGGPLDQYIEKKSEMMQQLNDSIDRHNEEVAAALGEEVPENITDEDIARSRAAKLDLQAEAEEYSSEEETSEEYVDDLEKELEEDNTPVSVQPQKLIVTAETSHVVEKQEPVNPEGVNFDLDEEDFEDLDSGDDVLEVEKLSDEEILEKFQQEITDKIAPVSKALDIRGFTRAKKGVRASAIVQNVQKTVAEWPLMNAGTKISMTDFSGTDIDDLSGSENMSRLAILNKRYTTMYNHIVSDSKPESMESWVKSLPYSDNDNVYMAIYASSFADANYIPYDCEKCGNTFLSDNIPLSKMYDIEEESAKERFDSIMNGSFQATDMFVVEDVVISDTICITFRQPSVHTVLFENSYLDDAFARKYRDVIAVLSYIDDICYIDAATKTLFPVEVKRFPTNKVKDVKSRIIEYSKIIKTLTPDQYSIIIAYVNAINSRKNVSITYRIPECKCPRCNNTIPERATTAEELVFMRHQLAALATTSIN